MGGFVRASWDEANELIGAANVYTIRKYGPDRVVGFSPIPAMSMVSYAAGTRYLSLIGGTCLSFYDWYCDLPPSSPQTFGEQTDVPESADWYNAMRSEEHTSELQSLMRISYAVFCLKKKKTTKHQLTRDRN